MIHIFRTKTLKFYFLSIFHIALQTYAFFLSPMISFIPIIIRIGKIRAAKIPNFRLSFNALEIIPT